MKTTSESESKPPSPPEEQVASQDTTPEMIQKEEEEEEDTSYGFLPVQTAAEVAWMLEAINTNMEFKVAEILDGYEEYITQNESQVVSMDRILLRCELSFDEEYTDTASTITEAMGYTTEVLEDALVRFEARSLAGSGEAGALTVDEIGHIERCIEALGHLRRQVTGSTTPTAVCKTKTSEVSFFDAAQLQGAVTAWLLTNGPPDDFTKFAAYMEAAVAQSKCDVLLRAGFSVPPDLLEAADEEILLHGKAIFDAFNTRMDEEKHQRGIDTVEWDIALCLYSDLPEFEEATVSVMRVLLGGDDGAEEE